MQITAESARKPAPISTRGRIVAAACAVGLLLIAGLVAATTVKPTYEVWYGAERVGAGRDPGQLEQALSAWANQEMGREVQLTAAGQTWPYRLSELGLVIAPAELQGALRESVAALPWWQRLAWSRPVIRVEEKARWDRERLAAALYPIGLAVAAEPVDAQLRIENQAPVIIPEVEGRSVEPEVVLQALQGLGQGQELSVPITARLPAVTKASLESMRIRTLVAEWTTHYDPTIPRAENVEKAAAAFDGLLLKPGEILSYNATVGPINAATGWKEAYVIVGGELVEGIGGGVCQVATTLYGAALRANLEIMERHQHQLAVPYVPASQDAAIAQGWEDLKLRNTALGHLLIEAEAGGGSVTFRLYGEVPEGQEVKIESKVFGSRPFATKSIVDHTLAPGEQRVKLYGSPGLISEGYRLLYQHGQLIRRELLSRDNYLPSTQVVMVGPSAVQPPPANPNNP